MAHCAGGLVTGGGDQSSSSHCSRLAWSAAEVSELLSMGSKSTKQARGCAARVAASQEEPEPDSKRMTKGVGVREEVEKVVEVENVAGAVAAVEEALNVEKVVEAAEAVEEAAVEEDEAMEEAEVVLAVKAE